MNIPLISGQLAKLHIKLETEDDFELYGGTTKAGFSITPERPESKNEWLVTIDELDVAGKPLTRFDVYVRQLSSGREWVVLSGKLLVSPRSAGVEADKLAPIEYNVTIPVVENAVDLTGAAIVTGIPGPRGWSAYEIAVQNGFVGSEPEWLESMRQQTATLAVEQVTPLMERAETAADKSEREAAAAKTEQETAAAHAKAAKESELAAAEHKNAAAGEVTKAAAEVKKAAAEVEKAKQERETAAGHATAAAKSAQDALANQQSAKQAAQTAQTAKSGAEQAAANADASKSAAQTAEGNAKASASQASADKAAAEKAKADAQAAQGKAEASAAEMSEKAEQLENNWYYWNAWFKKQTNLYGHFQVPFTYNEYPCVKSFDFALDEATNVSNMFKYCKHFKTFKTTSLEKVVNADSFFHWCRDLELTEWKYDMPNLINANGMFNTEIGHLVVFDANVEKVNNADLMFFKQKKLTTFTSSLPALTTGIEMFYESQLNKDSALRVLNSIPAYTSGSHALTIGIHVDHKNDEEVLEAIDNAESKGWTLKVQWNGTPTSTASTMAMGYLIYAKVGEHELPDGTTERVLDWGHYVTNWEERGYEQFRSLESAYRYFGLEMPEETLTETE